jgi:hypothetical protein
MKSINNKKMLFEMMHKVGSMTINEEIFVENNEPAWLETLWNVDARLAREAEEYINDLKSRINT